MTIENLNMFDKLCTGCLSCVNICPRNAIGTGFSDDGFAYPKVNANLCVDCGLCVKACAITEEKNDHTLLKIYSAWAEDPSIRKSGSSGGIFPLVAEETMKNGGAVYGVAFSRERLAYHTSTDEVDLSELFRSKYIQSDVGLVYRQIRQKLLSDSDKKVLFCGTPCQVRGLKKYLYETHTDDTMLVTIDFMCHGVPSPKYLEHMIARLEKTHNAAIRNVTFREKDLGWRRLAVNFYFENGEKKSHVSNQTAYYYFFLNNYTLRNSCFACEEFSKHVSDITIADDWNINKQYDDDKGASLILIHTQKGREAFDGISPNCNTKELAPEEYNEKIYSHKKYNAVNKQRWHAVYAKKGEKYVSTVFFKREKMKNAIRRKTRQYLGYAKKIVNIITKK